jgi:hypothetical protein
MMTVRKRKDVATKKCILKKVADIPGGVDVLVTPLGGDYLFEGTPISLPVNGKSNVIKYAQVVTAVTDAATKIEIEKYSHFKVGDFVMASIGAKAYAITAIDKSSSVKDVITLGTTLGVAIAKGGFIMEAAAESTEATSALKYVPGIIVGSGYQIPETHDTNILVDALPFAITQGNSMPDAIANALKGIVNIA